jgi:hypothetical protein
MVKRAVVFLIGVVALALTAWCIYIFALDDPQSAGGEAFIGGCGALLFALNCFYISCRKKTCLIRDIVFPYWLWAQSMKNEDGKPA